MNGLEIRDVKDTIDKQIKVFVMAGKHGPQLRAHIPKPKQAGSRGNNQEVG